MIFLLSFFSPRIQNWWYHQKEMGVSPKTLQRQIPAQYPSLYLSDLFRFINIWQIGILIAQRNDQRIKEAWTCLFIFILFNQRSAGEIEKEVNKREYAFFCIMIIKRRTVYF